MTNIPPIFGISPPRIQTIDAAGLRQATPSTMYSVDDNCYNILGQRVSKNTKGLIIYKGKAYFNK